MNKTLRLAAIVLLCLATGGLFAAAQQAAQTRQAAASAASFNVSPLETEVLGQNRWLRGGPASLRVIVTDHRTGAPVRASVKIDLLSVEEPKQGGNAAAPKTAPTVTPLHTGRTNQVGSLDAQFKAPALPPGSYDLRVNVDTHLGKDTVTQRIQIEQSEQILLTVDKPVYQPNQIVHIRALALDTADRRAVAEKPITFEVEDARGNKVFKKKDTLSKFGVASTDFALADEVNMGVFTIRAVLESGLAEKKVRVERYVLPKFKVGITTERPYYLPGENVKGTVQTDYFFGKPVCGGDVTITVNTVDIGVTKLAELQGKTDATGAYKFEYTLPNSFVGQPFEQGKAVVEFQVRVKDTADHQQMQSKSVPVVKDPILVVMVPESKQLVPGVQNRVYIACGTPDSAPVKDADVAVTTDKGSEPVHVTTDSMGIATYQFTPAAGQLTVSATVTAKDGHSATASQPLSSSGAKDGVLLRTDKTLAKVGDRLFLTALSSVKTGTFYVDVIRNKQTILTRAEAVKDGKTEIALPLTNDMVGTLEIHAYKILPDENIVRDTKTVVVSPADDLVIKMTPDKQEYRPGADAVLRFAVRNQANQPVAAALGLAIVDESVFALSEMQPGLEKIYFMLEKELMEPKYEIHGLRPSGLITEKREPSVTEPQRQRAAAVVLAAAPAASGFDYRANTYLSRWAEARDRLIDQMNQLQRKIQQAAQKFRQDTGAAPTAEEGLQRLADKGYLTARDLLDPWGHPYKVELFGQKDFSNWFSLSCAGPDGKWGTLDDVLGGRYYRSRRGLANGLGAPGGMGGFGGGRGGGGEGDVLMLDAAAAMPRMAGGMAMEERVMFKAAKPMGGAAGASKAEGGAPEPRVRQFFPETMYWNPALITDDQGRAEIKVPMADSITTWRMSMLANGANGQLGSATAPLKVFQDFFADIDLPVSLTQGDRVEIPVAVYNYLPGDQDVALTLDEQPWFKLEGPAKQTVHMGKNEVKVVYYPLTVNTLGAHSLKVTARGTKLSDALIRSIDVTPNGKEVRDAINDRLEKTVEKTVTFPGNAVAGADSLWVKLYPGSFSQVVEGLDGLLRMPNGCFEQTSSTTYPNVLVTDYLKATKKANPELLMKAEQYINVGYQRLVTFECKAGGFSWFGNDPAHQILTAYGLLEFSDMSKVHDVDPSLIARTQHWLAGRQKPDGTWPEDGQGIAEGIINRQTGALRSAAYITWALAESGYKGPETAKGLAYVKEHKGEAKDAYTLALILSLLTKTERDGEAAGQVAARLVEMAKQTDKAAWWEGDTQTFTGARKESADLETTGLAAYGLAKWGRNGGFTNKVLTYLVQSKDSFGTWSTTQGTVWSMKALLFASGSGTGGGKGKVTVFANGAKVTTIDITPEDSDVMRQIDLKENLKADRNDIKLTYEGEGSMLYQIASRYYMPWDVVGAGPKGPGPIMIDVAYDKKNLAQDDTAGVTVKVRNTTGRIAEMPLIDLGVPPGFSVVPDDLEAAVQAKKISKYTLAQRQIIVYIEKLGPMEELELHYAVKAKFPIKAQTPLSKAYPYYNPEQATISAPQLLVVSK